MKTIIGKKLRLALSAVVMLGASALAQASVVYTFTSTAVGAFGSGPYGTVTLDDTGTGITVQVSLRSDMNFVNTGGPHSIFSFNALGVAAGDISSILFNGVADSNVTVSSPGENTPFGKTFSLMLDCTGASCKNGAPGQHSDPLTFTIANSEYADFGFMAAGTTAFFASDVICTSGACNGATGAIGVVDDDGTVPPDGNPVPEPGSAALLGLGLLGLFLRRRFAK